MHDERGFTLMELMVGVVVAGTLLAMTVPGFVRFRSSLSRDQVKWSLMADLRYARQLAVTKHKSIVVKFGTGSTTTDLTTYQLFTDTNSNNALDSGEQCLNRTLPTKSYLTSVQMTPVNLVIFDSSGSLAPGCTGGKIAFRGPQGNNDTLMVSAIGMVYRP